MASPTSLNNERVKKFREKLKADPAAYDAYLAKERERDKKQREYIKSQCSKSAAVLKRKKLAETERKRKYREKLKQKSVKTPESNQNVQFSPEKGSYKTNSSFGKAVSRVKQSLPQSPSKRRAVVRKLAINEFSNLRTLLTSGKVKSGRPAITNEITEKIRAFYERDDISLQQPGKRDTISVKDDNGEKCIKQKRILLTTIKECYEMFSKEYPDMKVKLTKFFELKPPYILNYAKMPHNVCICKYHANMDFCVKALFNVTRSFPSSSKDLLTRVVCDEDNEKCMRNACSDCADYDIASFVEETILQHPVSWQKWSDSEGMPTLIKVSGCVKDVLNGIQKEINQFKSHCFVRRSQLYYFEKSREKPDIDTIILQIDFAENYRTLTQDEIQSCHWSHNQVTLFTAIAWLHDSKHAMIVVSDDLNHGKHAVWVFLRKILNFLKEQYSHATKVKIFSDGCAAQFKNRYTMSNLLFFEEDFNFRGEWNFFATSHGKGAVDGVGGSVKHAVWNKVKSRSCEVQSAEDFAKIAKQVVQGIEVFHVSKLDVEKEIKVLDERWKAVQPIPKIQSLHYFVPLEKDLLISFISGSETSRVKVLPDCKFTP